jgi:hypothetical protein
LLDRFWNRFSQNWDVLLHGNPSVDQFGGLKLAAGGELGIGVGEEDWGSGEREVLEDFARRTDGLVDIMVARFGEPSESRAFNSKSGSTGKSMTEKDRKLEPWHGAGHLAQAVDGVVFSGTGALSRSSLRDISQWVQTIHTYGEQAFGVKESPTSDRRKRRRRSPVASEQNGTDPPQGMNPELSINLPIRDKISPPPGIPPPIVTAVEHSLERATSSVSVAKQGTSPSTPSLEVDGWTKYLTLGYGSSWGHRKDDSHATAQKSESSLKSDDMAQDMQQLEPQPAVDPEAEYEDRLRTQIHLEENGHFLIGLKGELNEEDDANEDAEAEASNNRILVRTLHVEVEKKPASLEMEDDSYDTGNPDPSQDISSQKRAKRSRLRVVVYVHRPFIFTFLFSAHTASLSMPAFYRNMHTFFSPLHKPLSASTSPSRVAGRIAAASQTYTTSPPGDAQSVDDQQPIFALVYDPRTLSIHASVPNIPAPGSLAAEGLRSAAEGIPEGWTRIEAINVHSAILELVKETRPATSSSGGSERELERSVKTGRGWWVVWMRMDDDLPQPQTEEDTAPPTAVAERDMTTPTRENQGEDYFGRPRTSQSSNDLLMTYADAREAILVRRARDAVPKQKARGASGLWGFGGSTTGNGKDTGAGWGPARLAEGVGIDARKYVEGLLSLNR